MSAPVDRPRRGGKGGKAPATYTADRLDTVLKGQLVHLDQPALGDKTPTDGWLTVSAVTATGGVVSLQFVGSTESFVATGDRLVRVGWS